MKLIATVALMAAWPGLLPVPAAQVLTPCFLKMSIYEGIPGQLVGDLTFDPSYPDNPTQVRYLTSFDSGASGLDNFGARIEGWLTPTESGDYRFFLRSDDEGELWFGDSEANAQLIALNEPGAVDPFMEPETFDPATSEPQSLVAGTSYFIMVLYKDGTGGDVAQVAWRKEGDPTPAAALRPISGSFLSTLADDSANPTVTITQPPQDATGLENGTATFSVAYEATPPDDVCVQWKINGAIVPDALGPTFTTGVLTMADNGARVTALVVVPGMTGVESAPATLTVTPDTTPPVLLGAKGVPNQEAVELTFSERLDEASATTTANYEITGGGRTVAVSGASLSSDGTKVTLTTDPLSPGVEYTVTVNNVRDPSATPNVIAPDSRATFYRAGHLLQNELGFVVWEAEHFDRNLDGLWEENTTSGTPSGGVSMFIPNGVGGSEFNTQLEFDINFTRTGPHILWYRARADSGTDDSAWLHLDGDRPPERAAGNLASMSGINVGPDGDFVWQSNPQDGGGQMTFNIETPGVHTIGVGVREDGAYFDKFVITVDPTFNPAAFGPFGPPVTPREGEPPLSGGTVEITAHPQDATGREGDLLTLTAQATVSPDTLYLYQWQRQQGDTFTDLPGAFGLTFTIDSLTQAWDGAVVRLKAAIPGMTVFSDPATISVISDRTPPQVVKATGIADKQRVVLEFSEPVERSSAETTANYSISGGVSVDVATLLPNNRLVILQTGPQTVGTKYTVTVNGVRDLAVVPNTLVNGQARFYSLGDLLPQSEEGLLVFEAESYHNNIGFIWVEDSQRGTPSGGISMVEPNGSGGSEAGSQLEYFLTFTRTGTHILWYRASAASGSDDSAYFWLDGGRPPERASGNLASMSGFQNTPDFVWRSNPQEGGGRFTFEIAEAGPHTMALAHREDGAFFDKFVITTDPAFNPEAFGPFGPPESRAGAPPLPAIILSSPADGSLANAGADIELIAEVTPNGREIAKVEFFEGANKIAEATQSPYTATWAAVPAGDYVLTAVVTDDVADSVRSAPVNLSVLGGVAEDIVLSAALQGGNLVLTWQGGIAPFTVQKQTALSPGGGWQDVLTTDQPTATVPVEGASGFFRVVSAATP